MKVKIDNKEIQVRSDFYQAFCVKRKRNNAEKLATANSTVINALIVGKQRYSVRKDVLRKFSKFTGKHCDRDLFFKHRCFPVNFSKSFASAFLVFFFFFSLFLDGLPKGF